MASAFGKMLLADRVVTSWEAPFCSDPEQGDITSLCLKFYSIGVRGQHGDAAGRI